MLLLFLDDGKLFPTIAATSPSLQISVSSSDIQVFLCCTCYPVRTEKVSGARLQSSHRYVQQNLKPKLGVHLTKLGVFNLMMIILFAGCWWPSRRESLLCNDLATNRLCRHQSNTREQMWRPLNVLFSQF